MKIYYITPTGALCETEISPPPKRLKDWQVNGYIHSELRERGIEFKKAFTK